MSKSKIFIALIKACADKSGIFQFFKRCSQNPESFFKKKNLLDEYNSLNEEEKDIFKSTPKFFKLLVKHGFKTKEQINKHGFSHDGFCCVCGKETEFKKLEHGFAKTCSKECQEKLKMQTYKERYGDHPMRIKEYSDKRTKSQEITSLAKYGVKHMTQVNIRNYADYNLDFILSNFVDGFLIDKFAIKKYFNIKEQTYDDNILYPLKKINPNYRSKLKHGQKEMDFLSLVESRDNIILEKQYKIPNTKYKVDGYDPKTNTVYEFLGDYWHGNLDRYNPNDMNKVCKKTFKELNDRTFERLKIIKKLGYNVCYIWERDWDNQSRYSKLI